VAIGLIAAAAPAPFSDLGQIFIGVAMYSGIVGVGLLGLALALGLRVPLSRGEVAAVLSAVIPTALAVILGMSVLIPPS